MNRIDHRLPICQERQKSQYVHCRALPSEGDLAREAKAIAKATMPPPPAPPPAPPAPSTHSRGPASASAAPSATTTRNALQRALANLRGTKSAVKRPKNGYESHHLLKAIDTLDVATLDAIRTQDFKLLLRPVAGMGTTPLCYAMSRVTYGNGKYNAKYKDMCIVFVGFLSRWANHLKDEDLLGKDAREIKLALRSNLQLAAAFGLDHHYTEPLASYMQVLGAVEGATWLEGKVKAVANFLRERGQSKRPDKEVYDDRCKGAVDRLINREFSDKVAAVDDFRMNAATDLLMMGCAQALAEAFGTTPISTSCFGRDDRVLGEFKTRVDAAGKIPALANRGLYSFCETVLEKMSKSALGYDARVQALADACNWSN